MPWQEVCVQEQRVRFIHEWQKQEDSMAELCRRYGVSRRVGYKWLARYKQDGIAGLQDRSRAPKRHPNQTAAATEERILALRQARPLGSDDAEGRAGAKGCGGEVAGPQHDRQLAAAPGAERAPPAAAAGGPDPTAADPR